MRTIIAALCLLADMMAGDSFAQGVPDPGPAQAATGDPWPKTADLDGAKYTIYQPQLDSWDNMTMAAHAAVSVQAPGSQSPSFGMLKLTASTAIDKLARTVYLSDLRIVGVNFPSAQNLASSYQQAFQSLLSRSLTISLDRVEAALAALQAQSQASSVEVQNPVPHFVFSSRPAVLVTIDGDPAWRRIDGTSYERVLNTRPLLLRAGNTYYFHLFDGFLKAPGLSGPWTFDPNTPFDIARVTTDLAASGEIDLMTGPKDEKTGNVPSLTSGRPDVIVVTSPTELIVIDGAADWVALEGTGSLLYLKNTDANVFLDMQTQQNYVLVSGRWFVSRGLNGPWSYVAARDLPQAFARIPDDSPKENVKASIPGTKQAKEAIIATQIPQMAHVDRAKASFSPQLVGAAEIRSIERTSLKYVFNSAVPLIQAPGGAWFAVQKGVWFTASSLQGPWSVATSVPAEIYGIPANSPLYYVTYVKIYGVTPTTVMVGYLPGYMGAYVSDGTLVFGTGYAYSPFIGATTWYAAPVTYGYAANPSWTPWTGWASVSAWAGPMERPGAVPGPGVGVRRPIGALMRVQRLAPRGGLTELTEFGGRTAGLPVRVTSITNGATRRAFRDRPPATMPGPATPGPGRPRIPITRRRDESRRASAARSRTPIPATMQAALAGPPTIRIPECPPPAPAAKSVTPIQASQPTWRAQM